nr:hypothetical protein [Candidatus Entotheonella palauensis]
MHDGITFEQYGKPAVVLCTYPFEVTSRNIARVLGVPDYRFVMVEHPIGSRTLAEIQERAQDAYTQALDILLTS